MKKNFKLALVDADSLVYGIGFGTEGASEETAIRKMVDFLEQMIYVKLDCDDYKMWITGTSNFRNEIAVTQPYKGQRKGIKPQHYTLLREYLISGWSAVVSDGEEADDCVSIAAYESDVENTVVCSIDKDLDMIRGYHYNWKRDSVYYVSEEQALRNFYLQILTGDKIDNIQGLKGIGPVRAERILQGLNDPISYYSAVCDAYGGDRERVNENARLLWLRRTVGQVWVPPIDEEIKETINE